MNSKINKTKILLLLFMIIIFGCNSSYDENEKNIIMIYSLLSPSKVALSETNDTIFVYNDMMKSLSEMEKKSSNHKKNNTILLKILLQVNDYNKIIEVYNNKHLSKNKSFTQEVIMGIALDKRNDRVNSLKHFDNALKIIKENYKPEIHSFYEDYIRYLKTKDYETYKIIFYSPNNNHPIYKKALIENLFSYSNKENNYNDFITVTNSFYDFPFFPVEE